MTTPPNGEQLDLVPLDADQQAAQLRQQLDRLEALKREGRARAVDGVAAATAQAKAWGEKLDQAVAAARSAGATWQQIADAAGMSRPAAWERWANRG